MESLSEGLLRLSSHRANPKPLEARRHSNPTSGYHRWKAYPMLTMYIPYELSCASVSYISMFSRQCGGYG